MTRKGITIYGLVCALLGSILTLALCVLTYHPTPVSESVRESKRTEIRTDTIRLTDTIRIEKLKPILTEVIRVDTVKADTVLQVTRQDYSVEVSNDSIQGEIYASISGISPSLDSLSYRFDLPVKTITEKVEVERIVKQKTHLSYGLGVGAGYGIFTKKPDVYVGAFIGYSF